jgi:hypothetical protein
MGQTNHPKVRQVSFLWDQGLPFVGLSSSCPCLEFGPILAGVDLSWSMASCSLPFFARERFFFFCPFLLGGFSNSVHFFLSGLCRNKTKFKYFSKGAASPSSSLASVFASGAGSPGGVKS